AARQWGKMDPAQMMTHCALALEVATADGPGKQKLFGKLLAPFVRKSVLGEKPFGRDSPTAAALVVSDARDFDPSRERLCRVIELFCHQGPDAAARHVHSFFGKLSGDAWGV